MRSGYILTLPCPDRTGIAYRVTGLLFDLACNILDAQQFGDDARDLDEAPIIKQDVARVDHAMTPRDLVRLGSHTESLVLARAVRRHVEHRSVLNGHRTMIQGRPRKPGPAVVELQATHRSGSQLGRDLIMALASRDNRGHVGSGRGQRVPGQHRGAQRQPGTFSHPAGDQTALWPAFPAFVVGCRPHLKCERILPRQDTK